MKDTLKISAKIFGKIVLANVLSIITVISLSFLCNVMFTEEIGYNAIGTKGENSEQVQLYTHYNKDGEDTQLAKYEKEGYAVNKVGIRSPMSTTGNAVFLLLTALFCMSMGAMITYQFVWKEGNKDLNLVRYKRATEKKYKGVIIGLLASAPYMILLLVMGLGKWGFAKNFPVVLYQYINSTFFALTDIICSKAYTFGDLAIWQLLLLLAVVLLIPAFTGIAYYLGYKDILVSEKLTYKKTN